MGAITRAVKKAMASSDAATADVLRQIREHPEVLVRTTTATTTVPDQGMTMTTTLTALSGGPRRKAG